MNRTCKRKGEQNTVTATSWIADQVRNDNGRIITIKRVISNLKYGAGVALQLWRKLRFAADVVLHKRRRTRCTSSEGQGRRCGEAEFATPCTFTWEGKF